VEAATATFRWDQIEVLSAPAETSIFFEGSEMFDVDRVDRLHDEIENQSRSDAKFL
jgi:anti-sigma28 factor (negative regulator of flagellin synthesis)